MRPGKVKWIVIVLVLLLGAGTAFVFLDPESRIIGRVRGEPTFGGRYASAWLRDLGGSDTNARALAGESLRQGGADAVPVLIYVLSADAPPEARWRAADVVGQIGHDARPAGPELVKALNDPDPTVRSVVAKALEKLAPEVPGAVPALIARFPEVDAVRAVARFPDPAAVQPLQELLTHPDPTIRRNAARSLGRLGELALPAIPAIVAQLNDPEASVRSHAAEALGRLPSPEVVPELLKALDDPEAVVRLEAVRALGKYREMAKPALRRVQAAQADADPEVRKAATSAARFIDPSLAGKDAKSEKKKSEK